MNTADFVIITFFVFYFWRGWVKGFLRSVFGPVALMVCFFYSYFYFQKTHNFGISALICILGPFILNIILGAVLAIFHKGKDEKEEESAASVLNRLSGGLLNVLWMGALILVTVCFFLMIPIRISALESLRESLIKSRTVRIVANVSGDSLPFLREDVQPVDIQEARFHFKQIQKTAEFKKLMEDERVKKLFADPQTARKIQSQDILGLLNDPRIQEVLQDPRLIREFLAVNKKMVQINQNK